MQPKETTSAGSAKSSVSEQQRESASSITFDELPDVNFISNIIVSKTKLNYFFFYLKIKLSPAVPEKEEPEHDDESIDFMPDDAESIEGLLLLASAARNDSSYVKFMALYQVNLKTKLKS